MQNLGPLLSQRLITTLSLRRKKNDKPLRFKISSQHKIFSSGPPKADTDNSKSKFLLLPQSLSTKKGESSLR